jgi:Fe-coproporphyrin III synthase
MTHAPNPVIRELPILVLFPHNRCNCRCMMCDIWKIRSVREITKEDLESHLSSLRALKVKWIVFSGGEPLMHSDLPALCRLLRPEGIRLTLLTAGLSIERHAAAIAGLIDDVIVSIDGPHDVHDRVRGVSGAWRQLHRGIAALRRLQPQMQIHGRCTVQKQNIGELRNVVLAAHALGLDSVSFLAADVTSAAFNRSEGWSPERQAEIALNAAETEALEIEIEALISEGAQDFESGFIVERPGKLRRIAHHFRARLGHRQSISPRCNAPWVSAVVESDGAVRPCFFHKAIGNIREASLLDILNGDDALRFRRELDVSTNPTCRNCVCSLFLSQPLSGI